jgi:hypothetical protein
MLRCIMCFALGIRAGSSNDRVREASLAVQIAPDKPPSH